MKYQVLFSLKNNEKEIINSSTAVVVGISWVKTYGYNKRKSLGCGYTTNANKVYLCSTFIQGQYYRIYPAIRRGFCPSRMTSNN